MDCPDLNTLAALAEGGKASPDLARHLASCQACARELEEVRAALEQEQEGKGPDAVSIPFWKGVAAGVKVGGAHRRLFPVPLRWAAAVLLALGAGLMGWARRGEAPAPVNAEPARALASAAPSWLLEPGRMAPVAFLYSGGVRGALSRGARLQALSVGLLLEKGEAYLDVPQGVVLRLMTPDGAEVRGSGGGFWAGIQAPPQTLSGRWFRAAWAEDAPDTRVWAESGQVTLGSRDGKPGSEEVLPPGSAARWQEGRWIREEGGEARRRAESLRAALPAWEQAGGWTLCEDATPLPQGGWRLGARKGRARLASPSAPAQGLLTVSLRRPAPRSEIRIVFPQPGGSRAWRLADWASRGLGESATLTVAYGPWGARGDADGRTLWSMTPAELAKAMPAAEPGAGISLEGEGIDLFEAVLKEIRIP